MIMDIRDVRVCPSKNNQQIPRQAVRLISVPIPNKHYPLSPAEVVLAVTNVWRIRGKIIRNMLCCILHRIIEPNHITCQQFLQRTRAGLLTQVCVLVFFDSFTVSFVQIFAWTLCVVRMN